MMNSKLLITGLFEDNNSVGPQVLEALVKPNRCSSQIHYLIVLLHEKDSLQALTLITDSNPNRV